VALIAQPEEQRKVAPSISALPPGPGETYMPPHFLIEQSDVLDSVAAPFLVALGSDLTSSQYDHFSHFRLGDGEVLHESYRARSGIQWASTLN
jgi:hypothetical protein